MNFAKRVGAGWCRGRATIESSNARPAGFQNTLVQLGETGNSRHRDPSCKRDERVCRWTPSGAGMASRRRRARTAPPFYRVMTRGELAVSQLPSGEPILRSNLSVSHVVCFARAVRVPRAARRTRGSRPRGAPPCARAAPRARRPAPDVRCTRSANFVHPAQLEVSFPVSPNRTIHSSLTSVRGCPEHDRSSKVPHLLALSQKPTLAKTERAHAIKPSECDSSPEITTCASPRPPCASRCTRRRSAGGDASSRPIPSADSSSARQTHRILERTLQQGLKEPTESRR